MNRSRRDFLIRSSSYSMGMAALSKWFVLDQASAAGDLGEPSAKYGPLVSDPHNLLDLPKGFCYQIISKAGQTMDDGYITPGRPDGMGTFLSDEGYTVIVRNHELLPDQGPGPFGVDNSLLREADAPKLYDRGGGRTPHHGGTTTLVYDTKRGHVVRTFLSLAGACRNCAGGPTPWNTWITCEETVIQAGAAIEGEYYSDKDRGYNFEVPATSKPGLVDAIPLLEMGRFYHEAVAVDPSTSIVYQTEDREDGLIYRYIPHRPERLRDGGRLQALCLADAESVDTRNWSDRSRISMGDKLPVRWLDLEEVQSPQDDLRYRGYDVGAARFARGEGMWYAERQMYFACTNGGPSKKGQIWRLSLDDETNAKGAGGQLSLFVEPNDSRMLESADNLTAAPWGDLVVCEDRDQETVRLVGITPDGGLYTLANSHARSELAGAAFSPDGSTLFVNVQHRGLTLAITGPW
jgi:uncharacterized protein